LVLFWIYNRLSIYDDKIISEVTAKGAEPLMPKKDAYPSPTNRYPPAPGFSAPNPPSKPKSPKNITLIVIVVLFLSIIGAGLNLLTTKVTGFVVSNQTSNSLLTDWEPTTLDNQGAIVSSVAFSPDGKTFVSGNHNGTVKLWEVSRGKELDIFQGHKGAVYSVAFSPDGKTIAAGGENNTLLWEVSSKKELGSFPASKQTNSVAFSPDGKTIAVGNSDGTIRLWEVSSGKKLLTFADQSTSLYGSADYEVHANYISSIAFSPDGQTLASGSEQGTIKLWKLSRQKLHAILSEWPGGDFSDERYVTSLAFSPDGKTIAAGVSSYGNKNIQLWDVATEKEVASFFADQVKAVAFSPDGQTLATGGQNYTGLWEVKSRKELAKVEEPYGWGPKQHYINTQAVAFSPDGKMLVTGNSEGTLKLWKRRNLK
jgi:WD40 repeat protein